MIFLIPFLVLQHKQRGPNFLGHFPVFAKRLQNEKLPTTIAALATSHNKDCSAWVFSTGTTQVVLLPSQMLLHSVPVHVLITEPGEITIIRISRQLDKSKT